MNNFRILSMPKMTLIRSILVALIPFMTIFCSCASASSQNTDAYQYPIKPGTEEWKGLTSHTDMLAVCQIPESALQNMSTAGLLESVLNYPLLGDYMAFNSVQQGFDSVASQFNGLQEFLNRKDAGEMLLKTYSDMKPQAVAAVSPTRQDYQKTFGINDLELIVAQDPILSNLTDAQLRQLVQTAREKYLAKQQLAEVYGKSSLEFSARLIGKALLQAGYQPSEKLLSQEGIARNFLSTGSFATDEYLSDIMTISEQFLSVK